MNELRRPTRRDSIGLLGLCLMMFVIGVNTTAINTALPAISTELGVTVSSLGWAVAAYMLACASFVVVGGKLGDRFGRLRVLLGGIAIFVVASILIAAGGSEALVIGGRVLQGMGAAIMVPGSMSIVGVTFPGDRRPTALGLWSAGVGLGIAVGPVLAGILTDSVGWEWVWWSNLPVLAVAVGLIAIGLEESSDQEMEPGVDIAGIFTLAVGVFLLMLALDEGRQWGWGSARILGLFAGSVALLIAFKAVEGRVRSPLVHFSNFRSRIFLGSTLGTAAVMFSLIAIQFLLSLYTQSFFTLDYDAIEAGAALLPLTLLLFALSLVIGRIVGRFGARGPIVVGLGLIAIGLYLVSRASVGAGYVGLWPGLVVSGFGTGLAFSPASAIGVSAVTEDEAGEASGIINMGRYLGGALAITVSQTVYSGVAVARLGELFPGRSLTAVHERVLDGALAGAEPIGRTAVDSLPAGERAPFADAAREAVVAGFGAGVRVSAIITALAAVALFFLLRGARHPVEQRRHHALVAPGAMVATFPHLLRPRTRARAGQSS